MGASHGSAKNKTSAHADEIDEAAMAATTGAMDTDLSTRLELNISAAGLRRKITAFCITYVKRSDEVNWHVAGRTEVLNAEKQNLKWIDTIVVDFNFEVQTKVRVEVYNVTSPNKVDDLKAQEFIGSTETYIAVIVNAQGRVWTKNLEHFQRPNVGKISICAEEVTRLKHSISFTISGTRLVAEGFFSRKADPYVSIYRANKDVPPRRVAKEYNRVVRPDQRSPIFRSEVHKKNLNPNFGAVEMSVQQLCRGEEERPIILEVYDWNRTQADKFMGYAETTYAELYRSYQNKRPIVLQLCDPAKDKKGNGKIRSLGCLRIEDVEVLRKHSFLDYVHGGLEIGLIVAVDYTRSNGDPQNKESLHYHDTAEPNEYVMAIRAVGEILQHYDSDKKYPVYGFGAKIPPTRTITSHNFSLKGDFFDPEVEGIDGILDAYRDALQVVNLHGPTIFHEVVEHAGKMAEPHSRPTPSNPHYKYFILLIVTDGVINDMQETINAIVKCSGYPMSVVIVGVGSEDFSLMDELDADTEPLYSTVEKKYMERDIVQFVPFADYKDRSYLELARATLDEVPREVVNYFQSRKCPPNTETRAVIEAQYELDDFLKEERKNLLAAGISAGYQRRDVEAVLELGLPSSDINVLLDTLTHFDYRDRTKGNIFQQSISSAPVATQDKSDRKKNHLVRSRTEGDWGAKHVPGAVEEEPDAILKKKASTGSDLASKLTGNDGAHKRPWKKSIPKKTDGEVANMCKVCFENIIDTVLLECGHQVVCEACSADIGALCPLCRQTISRIVRTYNP